METRRFLNQYQPQTLQIATILLYINAVFALLSVGALLSGSRYALVELASLLGAGAAYGIANDKKWGYQLGLVAAIVPLVGTIFRVFGIGGLPFNLLLNLLFQGALVAVLVHPLSRNYVKTWFK